jgi:hypothetical protein
MNGPAARADSGWRLPAAEIERSIAAAARNILDDQQTAVSAIEGRARLEPDRSVGTALASLSLKETRYPRLFCSPIFAL